jgi:hypothetical protein
MVSGAEAVAIDIVELPAVSEVELPAVSIVELPAPPRRGRRRMPNRIAAARRPTTDDGSTEASTVSSAEPLAEVRRPSTGRALLFPTDIGLKK